VPEAGSGEPDICGGLENGCRGSRYPTLSAQNGERMGHPAGGLSLDVKRLVDSEHFLMPSWQAEDAKDSALVDHADLNMRLVMESRAFVELFAFRKQGSHCLVGQDCWFGFSHLLPGAVKMSNYGTVQVPLAFFGPDVLGKGFLGQFVQFDQPFVRGTYCKYAILCGEVQASPQVNDCAHYGGGLDVSPWQTCPLKRSDRVALPKVNAGAKPIVRFFADQKLRAAQNYLGGLDAASVVGKNEVIQTCGTPALICRLYRNNHPS